jgi:signal transduction histidine kinase
MGQTVVTIGTTSASRIPHRDHGAPPRMDRGLAGSRDMPGVVRAWSGRIGDDTARRSRRLLLGAMVAAAASALLVTVLPGLRFAYRNPEAHVALDSAAAVIGSLAACLLLGRLQRTAALRDLLLFAALVTLTAANLLLSVLPALGGRSEPAFAWAVLSCRLLAAGLLVAAAFGGARRLRAPSAAARRALVACLGACLLLLALEGLFADSLPSVIDPGWSPERSNRPLLVGHPLVLAAQLVAMALYAAAAVGFACTAVRAGDEFVRWLALGAILAAVARLNYFLFPSLYTDYLYTGDFFRFGFYVAMLVGAAREIGAYQQGLARVAVLEERRRMARDLHDGLAQDLAFITSQTRAIADSPRDATRVDRITSAAERALDDSRAAIAALTAPLDEPLDASLVRAAEEVAERGGARVRLDVEHGICVSASTRQALVRLVREAVTNAVRHGEAREVWLRLASGPGLRLTIEDRGHGFDPAASVRRGAGGFGLISMRERAEALGGELRVTSAPGAGTEIEVIIP